MKKERYIERIVNSESMEETEHIVTEAAYDDDLSAEEYVDVYKAAIQKEGAIII